MDYCYPRLGELLVLGASHSHQGYAIHSDARNHLFHAHHIRWNHSSIPKHFVLEAFRMTDDMGVNEEILTMLKERMAVGVERYGHGLRPMDDTTQWGTKEDSWVEMGIEEVLDNLIYIATAMLRIRHLEEQALKRHKELNARASALAKKEMELDVKERSHKGGSAWWKPWSRNRS